MDESCLAQTAKRAAQIQAKINGTRLRHGRFGKHLGKCLAVFGQQINLEADAILLRLDLIAAVAADVRAGGKLFKRLEFRLIIGGDLLVIILRVLDRGGRAGEHQRVDLLLRFRDADVLQIIGLIAFCAFYNIDRCTAVHADAFDELHVRQQRRYHVQFWQFVRLLYKHIFILCHFHKKCNTISCPIHLESVTICDILSPESE